MRARRDGGGGGLRGVGQGPSPRALGRADSCARTGSVTSATARLSSASESAQYGVDSGF